MLHAAFRSLPGQSAAASGSLARIEGAINELTKVTMADAAKDHQRHTVDAALNAMYALWEVWRQRAQLSTTGQDRAVSGSADGETAAALVFARGGQIHKLVGLESAWVLAPNRSAPACSATTPPLLPRAG